MRTEHNQRIIGVDGGGTKTVACLAKQTDDGSWIVLGRGLSGPGNPRAVGFDVACQNIFEAIKQAYDSAILPFETVHAAVFCLAGAGREGEQTIIDRWAIEHRIANHVHTLGDAAPILAAASQDFTGVALISGTGSFCWGRNRFGMTSRSGGWGYLFGDEGSAYQLALSGLRAASHAADGRGPKTSMLEGFLIRLQAETPMQLIERIYAPTMDRVSIAELASIVFEAFASGDEIAKEIVKKGASELAAMVVNVSDKLELLAGETSLAISGGVLAMQPILQKELESCLKRLSFIPMSIHCVNDPVHGAVAIANRLARLGTI